MSNVARYPALNSVDDNSGRGITCRYLELDGSIEEHSIPLSSARTFVKFKNVSQENINVVLETTRPMIGDTLTIFAKAGDGFASTANFNFVNSSNAAFSVDQQNVSSISFVFDGEIWIQLSSFKAEYTPPPGE